MGRYAVFGCLLLTLSGCGLFADAIADLASFDVDADFFGDEFNQADASETLQPLTFDVAVDETNPTVRLSELLASADPQPDWDAFSMLVAASNSAENDGEAALFEIGATNFTLGGTADPIGIRIEVLSQNDVIWGRPATPVDVAECSFTIAQSDPTPETTYETNTSACVTKWVAANGTPDLFDMSITVFDGSVTNQTSNTYNMGHSEEVRSRLPFNAGCKSKLADDLDDVLGNVQNVDFTDMGFVGFGWTDSTVDLFGLGFIIDSTGETISSLSFFETIEENTYVSVDGFADFPEAADLEFAGNIDVQFEPESPSEWIENGLNALAGTQTGSPGSAKGCYAIWGPVPRMGDVGFSIGGEAGLVVQ